ncbi:myb domain-containing protein [Heterostelium album PN500]|uniref:Myb domain-containing protein n=1 Tax=Heterostelium pallidum (strain ATCC 26659 / Pp 5 / PN500) TaxID=670386 RepID=D3BTP8_HETP5|nr:myb domain-containing protein [Heterostelium album PN500]EFA75084.1 myb domain-containing protein [Heterostelium album PN500]|eukprot:XP_020427218.1 myb domain-containing protein [Heterostelium album PN500]
MDFNNTPIKDTEEYKQLTKSLEILEQQRKTREEDIERLKRLHKDALENPIEFLERLISGTIVLPTKQPIEPIPILPNLTTNLTKRKLLTDDFYTTSSTVDNNSNSNNKSKDVNNNNILDSSFEDNLEASSSSTTTPSSSTKKKNKNKDDYASFNRPWSEEEQKRLEELLAEFPEEPVAAHRWTKIANALKNRTPKQVASRTQKYFVKLHKLGLPIPGKPPNLPSLFPKPPMKKKNRNSTATTKELDSPTDYPPTNYNIPPGVPISPPTTPSPTKKSKNKNKNSKESNSTTSTPKSKSKSKGGSSSSASSTKSEESALVVHEGYKCDGCDEEPIIGIRWRCEECLEIDLCDECNNTYEEIGSHKSTHHMRSYTTVDPDYFRDEDYRFSYTGGESNYLDPNYTK